VILGIVVLACCNQHLDIKYRDVLHGRSELTEEVASQIYSEFQSVHAVKS